MSNATPMSTTHRLSAYYNQLLQFREPTPRQHRQHDRMVKRQIWRDGGFLPHGASGVPVRRPLARSAASRGENT